jgi:hypothetical protein
MICKDAANNATECLLAVVLVTGVGHAIELLYLEDEVAEVMSNVTLITTLRCERHGIKLIIPVLGRMGNACVRNREECDAGVKDVKRAR